MHNLILDIPKEAIRIIYNETSYVLSEEVLVKEGYKKEDILEYLKLSEDIKSLLCDSHIIVDKEDILFASNRGVIVNDITYSIENGKIIEVEITLFLF